MVEAVQQGQMQGLILLGFRVPQEKGIDVERNVLAQKWDSERDLRLWQKDSVVLC
jgi:hypothetical protein